MRAAVLLHVLASTVALAAGSDSAAPEFHPSQTAAEQTLARILKLDRDKPEQINPAIGSSGRRARTTPPPGATYLKYLTMPLALAILAEESRDVKLECGGIYKSGEECGMDSDPIICAQDSPDSYLFRTKRSGPSHAIVEAAWPPDQGARIKADASYRLKLTDGVWKIDGISCGAGGAYNWSVR
jgi:hypothetical protein